MSTNRRQLLTWGVASASVAIVSHGYRARAAELSLIQQRGYLSIAVKDNRPPLGFRDAGGQLVGLEIDIARRLATELLGHADTLQLKPVLNAERLNAVTSGQVDMAIAGVTATSVRARLVRFSTPYYFDGTAILAVNPQIQTLGDLHNLTIAVLQGSTTIAVIRHHLPTVRLIGVASYQAGDEMLASGQADAFAGDATVLAGWRQKRPSYALVPTILTADPLAIVLPKGLPYDPLYRRINQLLTTWQDDGWLRQQATRWGLP